MLEDSVDFMLKKAQIFNTFTIYVNTVKLIQHLCVYLSVPTTFDE